MDDSTNDPIMEALYGPNWKELRKKALEPHDLLPEKYVRFSSGRPGVYLGLVGDAHHPRYGADVADYAYLPESKFEDYCAFEAPFRPAVPPRSQEEWKSLIEYRMALVGSKSTIFEFDATWRIRRGKGHEWRRYCILLPYDGCTDLPKLTRWSFLDAYLRRPWYLLVGWMYEKTVAKMKNKGLRRNRIL